MQNKVERAAYWHAKNRCNNPRNFRYYCYGGRGIQFNFESFEQFIAVLGPRPGVGYSLDRIDVNGNYEPSNCRWATSSEQHRNTRRNRHITIADRTMLLTDWCKEYNIPNPAVQGRLSRGYSIEQAITMPLKPWTRMRNNGSNQTQ